MTFRPRLATVAFALALAPAATVAQAGAGTPKPISVRVQITTTYPGPVGTVEEEVALNAKARSEVYDTAAGECVLISKALGGACSLTQVSVTTRPVDARVVAGQQQPTGIVAQGTLSFTVTPGN